VVIHVPQTHELTVIPANWTDVGLKAAQTQQALPEDVRNLTLQDLVKRTDLLPDTVKLTTEVTLGNNKVLAEGTELLAGRLMQAQNGQLTLLLAEKDAKFNQYGSLDKMNFDAQYTDVIQQIRAKAATPVEQRKLRSSASLNGKLVDAQGNPLPESANQPQYYVVYFAANWCGWCTRFTPTLIKFHEEVQAKHPQVQIVYLSSDRTAEEMGETYKRHNMPWPAVAYDKRSEVLGLMTMSGPSTPHLAVYTADGRLFHDGMPAGMNGANAAIQSLKRELSKASSSANAN
jgi:thiol-disulfide isomerase/thioredoxin